MIKQKIQVAAQAFADKQAAQQHRAPTATQLRLIDAFDKACATLSPAQAEAVEVMHALSTEETGTERHAYLSTLLVELVGE